MILILLPIWGLIFGVEIQRFSGHGIPPQIARNWENDCYLDSYSEFIEPAGKDCFTSVESMI